MVNGEDTTRQGADVGACEHVSCGREHRVWLPVHGHHDSEAVLHPWCTRCGMVRNVSDDRPHRRGYWMNVLAMLVRRFSLTQCQKRLIAREIARHDEFDDTYGTFGSSQRRLFTQIVSKYTHVTAESIERFVY